MYNSHFEHKEPEFLKFIGLAIKELLKAKKIHDTKFIYHEATTNYKQNNSSFKVTDAEIEFNAAIRSANIHLMNAQICLETAKMSSYSFTAMKNWLILTKICLLGNTNLLSSELIKSSYQSGANVRSILLELSQSKKLNDNELLVVNSIIPVFFTTCLSYNKALEHLENTYPNMLGKDLKIHFIKNKNSIEVMKKLV